jgi:energy-coupling factor transporter ATP-binding protein EcfA2
MRSSKKYFELITAVDDDDAPHRFFFIDGPAGSGKTYLYNTLISYLRHCGKSVLPFATTGIAADLLGGRTAHSGFRLPIPVMDTSTSSMKIPSIDSVSIQQASLLIIDEASMLSSNALRIINMLLKEIMRNDKPFGGKTLLLGGDFRQTANVIPRGSNADILESCIKQSPLWIYVQKFNLTDNMRAFGQNEFSTWLLKIGDGTLTSDATLNPNIIEIPQGMVIETNLSQEIYGENIDITSQESLNELSTNIILTTKNKDALILNSELLHRILGDITVYKSADSQVNDDEESAINFPIEFLNQQMLSGMPPHELKLKKGCIIIIIRNLNP